MMGQQAGVQARRFYEFSLEDARSVGAGFTTGDPDNQGELSDESHHL
jgi:hypothetical protein